MRKEKPLALAMAARMCASLATGVLVATSLLSSARAEKGSGRSVPVIYSSDLFHPPDDPDDWFDLATLFSIDELDVRGIVLDQGEKQMRKPGRIPLEQMTAITGKKVAFACGLSNKLKSPSDKGLDQPERFQKGVKLIINVLQNSERKVTLITVGSLRDVCAAFNRAPQLLKEKVEKLYISAGNSGGGNEYNVGLDPHAYVGVMRSGLPIYWLPCFGREPFVSKWGFKQGDLLGSWSVRMQDYFAYGLMKLDPKKVDPVVAIQKPIADEVKKRIWGMNRSMWSTASFIDAAGRTLHLKAGRWRTLPRSRPGEKRGGEKPVFRFVPAKVTVSDKARTPLEHIEVNSSEPNMRIFRFEGTLSDYNEAMKQSLDGLLKDVGR